MNSTKVIVLQGGPASGKSTWAKKYVKLHSSHCVIISKDAIRHSLGEYWVPSRENLVSDIEIEMMRIALNHKFDIILDSTNLNPKTIKTIEDVISSYQYAHPDHYIKLDYKEFHVSIYKAIIRDFWRSLKGGKRVGIKPIKIFQKRYNCY